MKILNGLRLSVEQFGKTRTYFDNLNTQLIVIGIGTVVEGESAGFVPIEMNLSNVIAGERDPQLKEDKR